MPQKTAAFAAEVDLSEASPAMDLLRLTREGFGLLEPGERASLLDVLFKVAEADGFVSSGEIETIHDIARHLLMSDHAVIAAKMRISRDRRAE